MPDYSKGLIYTIKSCDDLYVGSTTNFIQRKFLHKSRIKNHDSKLYKTIRDNECRWDMKPYKEFPCENKTQLTIEEERIRCELNANLNSHTCYGKDMENYKNYQKEYRQQEKYKNDKKEYREKNKEYHKKYHEEWKKNNKEKIKEKKSEICVCEICGNNYTRDNKKRHQKTKKCLDAKTLNPYKNHHHF